MSRSFCLLHSQHLLPVSEMDVLLSDIPDDGTPLIVMGDMNIHTDKTQVKDFLALISSLDLELALSPPTQKAGKILDLVLTHNRSTADKSYSITSFRPFLNTLLSCIPTCTSSTTDGFLLQKPEVPHF